MAKSNVIPICRISMAVKALFKGEDTIDWVDDLGKYLVQRHLIPKGYPLDTVNIGFPMAILKHFLKTGVVKQKQIWQKMQLNIMTNQVSKIIITYER